LKALYITDCEKVTDEGLAKLVGYGHQDKGCKSLEYINIGYCESITVHGVEEFIRHAQRIQKIDIRHTKLNSATPRLLRIKPLLILIDTK